ncbi:MAG: hypothetical protein JKY30_02620 [Flavobacteriales bacterium]|nr:hypothetical protein [Flavobacteriales bacterium]
MTGNVVLDVVISLVFIFLIYSLLASVLQEIIATALGLRARNLKHAIRRMLEDDDEGNTNSAPSNLTQKAQQLFQKKKEGLLEEFYRQPVIKYLASGKRFSKPSYMSESDFSMAILEILKKNGGKGVPNIDKIKQALSNENNLINKETRAHLVSLLDDAQNDLVKFRANLEDWFNNTMERAAGWYKKTIQFNLTIIGFVLAVIFNVNTIEIVKTLSTDKNVRDSMVKLAIAASENEEIKRVVNTKILEKTIDTTEVAKTNVEKKLDSLFSIYRQLEIDAEKVNNILGFKPLEVLPVIGKRIDTAQLASVKKSLPSKQKLIDDYVVEFPNSYLADKTAEFYAIKQRKDEYNKVSFYAEFHDWSYLWNNFWGYLLTALAISLGAPFWFDLLNKLVKLRSSIQRSPKNDSQKGAANQGTISTKQRVG